MDFPRKTRIICTICKRKDIVIFYIALLPAMRGAMVGFRPAGAIRGAPCGVLANGKAAPGASALMVFSLFFLYERE